MINKIERAQSSPTASLLGRLSGAFGLTLSTLLAEARALRAGASNAPGDQTNGAIRKPAISVAKAALRPGLISRSKSSKSCCRPAPR